MRKRTGGGAMQTMRTKRNAFTLVELLVVMTIITILMGILVPAIMPLLGSKGVRGSAMKLQAVCLNARALAAKTGDICAVTFNASYCDEDGTSGVNTDDKYYFSRDWEDCWYAVVKYPVGSTPPFSSTVDVTVSTAGGYQDIENDDFNYKQVGPRYYLEEGTGFMTLTYQDDDGDTANKFSSDKPAWEINNYLRGTATQGGYDIELGDLLTTATARIPCGFTGAFRIEFYPDGSAKFWPAAGFLPDGANQWITISREGTTANESYYDNRLSVVVNQYTGLAEIRSPKQ